MTEEKKTLLAALILYNNAHMYAHSTFSGGDLVKHLSDVDTAFLNALDDYIDSRIAESLEKYDRRIAHKSENL